MAGMKLVWPQGLQRRHLAAWVIGAWAGLNVAPVQAGVYEDFFQALDKDDAATLEKLLALGVDPNIVSPQGQIALILAIQEGRTRCADVLMAQLDLKVNLSNVHGETALMMAALKGRVSWAFLLIERGAQVNRPGWAPIHYAATGSSTDMLDLLVSRKADLEARAPNGATALLMAAKYGSPDLAEHLLKLGADPDARTRAGLTAADFARQAQRNELAARLESAAKGR